MLISLQEHLHSEDQSGSLYHVTWRLAQFCKQSMDIRTLFLPSIVTAEIALCDASWIMGQANQVRFPEWATFFWWIGVFFSNGGKIYWHLTTTACLQHRFIKTVIFIFKNIHICINLLDLTAFASLWLKSCRRGGVSINFAIIEKKNMKNNLISNKKLPDLGIEQWLTVYSFRYCYAPGLKDPPGVSSTVKVEIFA